MNVRSLLLLLAVATLATPVFAATDKLPSPGNCTVPRILRLVGRDAAGTADPIGEFDLVIRDIANIPKSGAQVVLDFSASPGAEICTDQSPTGGTNCAAKDVVQNGVTGFDGIARFRVVGWCNHAQAPAVGATLRVFADGVILATVPVAAFDQDGDGVGAPDLSHWLDDFFHAPTAARSDLDGDGAVTATDLSLWLQAFFAGGSLRGSGTSTCPN